ncbi:MAG TPA: hypothetical protein VH186_11900, partial [Chloroflexia bacterium]|nr:hypothetical protein [Chloroflexia bacterium]
MDVFKLREKVVSEYSSYITSFLKILDPAINKFVSDKLSSGVLWPTPLVQLSPAYQPAQTIEEMVNADLLHPLCLEIFKNNGK